MMRKRNRMLTRMRILGIGCGMGCGLSFVAVSASMDADTSLWAWIIERVVIPAVLLLLAVIGWFSRAAYTALTSQIAQHGKKMDDETRDIRERFQRRDDAVELHRQLVERMDRIDTKLDALMMRK